uniref:WGS project CBMG000000000 data, contig CS5907-c002243 n=1 Tax=Fusarium acuminatum CS5907 TaxID=1318461 RepID=A0A090M9I3_9HYPO|nr:unnamed protein product [Fusarium acuminatum CS5907]
MSTVAIQFDPVFSMGPRSAFTWPGPLETSASSSSLLSPGLSSMGHVSGNSLTPPPQSRSVTSSPPRLSLSADQREVKRQSDRVRRDSRLVNRMRRANSNSYAESQSSMGLPSVTDAMNISAYSTAPAPVTLMTQRPSRISNLIQHLFTRHTHKAYKPTIICLRTMQQFMQDPTSIVPDHHLYLLVRINLLRHQREKSGQAAKASCPNCGAEFTRTTARNGHLLHDKCKGRRNS